MQASVGLWSKGKGSWDKLPNAKTLCLM